MACVDSAATPIATSARSAGGSGRTMDRNSSARAPSSSREHALALGGHLERALPPVGDLFAAVAAGRAPRASVTTRLVADGERPICSARSAMVSVSIPSAAYSAASWAKPRFSSARSRGKADDQVAPQGAAHGDAVGQQPRVLDLVARGRRPPG